MYRPPWRMGAVGLFGVLLASACHTALQQAAPQPVRQTGAGEASAPPAWIARMDSGPPRVNAEDVRFMQGMIHHHAQAVLMAGWAPTHGASRAVRELGERIVVSQRDEIAFMQRWLRERHLDVPDADASHDMMPGMESMLMPGMLNADQLAQLEHAQGADFDRLFLQFMIMHHQGALSMVQHLFDTYGAAQDGMVFKFASDVSADQSAEIDRMTRLLAAQPGSPGSDHTDTSMGSP